MNVVNKIRWEQKKLKMRKGWNEVKDIMLMLILLNALINNLQHLDFSNNWGGGGSNIRENSVVEIAEAKQPIVSLSDKTDEQMPDNSPALVVKNGFFSAYNADVNQTDADPNTMANGETVYVGAIANNCLPFGTKVEIDGKQYTVADRMNKRYNCDHFDIFMETYDDAIKFGRKSLEYTVIE